MTGAEALGLIGRSKSLQPQQLLLADVVNHGAKFTGVLMPRRSTKTTTLFALAIGRCLSRQDYYVAYTSLTTGKMTRQRFLKDVVPALERVYPDEATRPFKLLKGAGGEQIRFTNGSIMSFVSPLGDSFRSDAYDLIILDEAGEPEEELADDIMTAALPTLDTRPAAQVIKAGTAGQWREGNMLWSELELGKAGDPRHAILAYGLTETPSTDELGDWDWVAETIATVHPGLGGLTSLDAIQDNWRAMPKDRFAAEYLGVFGTIGTQTFLSAEAWTARAKTGDLPSPPPHFRLAFAVHPDQSSAAIAAAWRDEEGRAQLLVLDHRRGTEWVYAEALRLSRKYKTPLVFDPANSVVSIIADRLSRARPKPKVEPQTWPQVSNAAALIVDELSSGNLDHWGQDMLDRAVFTTVKRGTRNSKRWAFGRAHEDADITPLEAVSLALRAFDEAKPPQQKLGIISS